MRRTNATLAALSFLMLALPLALSGCGSDDSTQEHPSIGGDYGAFFGIAPNETPNDADFARMTAGGIGSYHLQLSWQTVESTKGEYDWSVYDAEFRQLARNGIEPIPYVIGTPAAYEKSSSIPPTNDAEAFDAWADFLKEATQRYGPDGALWQSFASSDPDIPPKPVHVWEIWNEPNSSVFWEPAPDPDAYAELLKRSSRVIKAADPAAEVMTAGMFTTPQSDGAIVATDFLQEVYSHRGVADVVDIVGIHPYGPTVGDVIKQVDDTHALIERVGDDASLWVTEIGWGSDPTSTNQLAKTPDKQAELLQKSFELMLARREELGLRGIIWFTWRDVDTGVECGWCSNAGLVDGDRDSKPNWLAFTEITGGSP
ncbi:MAG: glycosyl hydrolase [Solirubrobacterales bacterium]